MSGNVGFGANFEKVTVPFVPGINKNVVLKEMELVENDKGLSLSLVWENKDGGQVKNGFGSKLPPTLEKAYPKQDRTTGEMETQEQAFEREVMEFSTWVRHIITNYVPRDKFEAALVKWQEEEEVQDFKNYCKFCIGLLPENFSSIKGSLIVGYNNKGYIEPPSKMWVTGNFWSTYKSDGSLRKPLVIGKYIKIQNPVHEVTAESNIPIPSVEDVTW